MQNKRKLIRMIGKMRDGIGEYWAAYDDGATEHFIGRIKTGRGLLFAKKNNTMERHECEGHERRIAS